MKLVRMLHNDVDNLAQKDEITELYSLYEIRECPGVSKKEAKACEDTLKYTCNNIIGFIKSSSYTEYDITFVQCYEDEVEFAYV